MALVFLAKTNKWVVFGPGRGRRLLLPRRELQKCYGLLFVVLKYSKKNHRLSFLNTAPKGLEAAFISSGEGTFYTKDPIK
jgi:hypothetical protein